MHEPIPLSLDTICDGQVPVDAMLTIKAWLEAKELGLRVVA